MLRGAKKEELTAQGFLTVELRYQLRSALILVAPKDTGSMTAAHEAQPRYIVPDTSGPGGHDANDDLISGSP